MGNKTGPSNLGAVVSVRGSVIDIRFEAHLPPIYSLLHAQEGEIAIEVLAQLDAHRVRGIALTPTQGLARGMAVEETGGPLKAPVGRAILSRMFDVFGNAIDRQAAPTEVQWRSVHQAPPALARRSTLSEIFETGIKVIDQLASEDRKVVARAWRLERFLTQPFFATEQFSGIPGKLVSLKDALEGCERILRDEFKDSAESALYIIGAIDEAKKKAPPEIPAAQAEPWANMPAAPQAPVHRARCNRAARRGEYTAAMERT